MVSRALSRQNRVAAALTQAVCVSPESLRSRRRSGAQGLSLSHPQDRRRGGGRPGGCGGHGRRPRCTRRVRSRRSRLQSGPSRSRRRSSHRSTHRCATRRPRGCPAARVTRATEGAVRLPPRCRCEPGSLVLPPALDPPVAGESHLYRAVQVVRTVADRPSCTGGVDPRTQAADSEQPRDPQRSGRCVTHALTQTAGPHVGRSCARSLAATCRRGQSQRRRRRATGRSRRR